MNIKVKLTKRNYKAGKNKENKFIVIHYVGAVSSALANANYFHTTYRGASAHYFVDENEIYQVVKEGDIAWHVGAIYYRHKICRNSNSIGIEMCCYNNNGVIDVSNKVVKKTIELTRELMKKYDIPVENVLMHNDVTGKKCPAPFIADPSRWKEFKRQLLSPVGIEYSAHIENIGWQESKENGEIAGTVGEALRIEALVIKSELPIEYRGHIEGIGWTDWVKNGSIVGTTGQSKRLEAIELKADRELIATAHIQDIGWEEKKIGKHLVIGTEGRALRLEALTLEYI